MERFDAIVVGAGPAGSSAALALARAGMTVALLDSAAFPREKLCGGLLSRRTEKLFRAHFGDSWSDAVVQEAAGAAFYAGSQLIRRLDGYSRLFLTSRSRFDLHLVNLACKAGAYFLQKSAVNEVDPAGCQVRLADGRNFRAEFLLGCDGATSRVAKALGSRGHKASQLAIGLEVNVPAAEVPRAVDLPEIYFGIAHWGYGWIFPKGDCLTIGVGGLVNRNPEMKKVFSRFLMEVCGRLPAVPVRGHPIPYDNFTTSPGRGNVLLAGDAAGLVEPITGEGIAFAIESGWIAARSVLAAAAAGRPKDAATLYKGNLRDMHRLFRHAWMMRLLVFPPRSQRLFLSVLARSETPAKKFLDLLADDIDYRDYARFIARRLAGRALRTVSGR